MRRSAPLLFSLPTTAFQGLPAVTVGLERPRSMLPRSVFPKSVPHAWPAPSRRWNVKLHSRVC